MKDVTGKNVGTIVSYLKRSLILLVNYGKLPTNKMGLLKDTFCSAECEDFTAFITSIYYKHKRKTNVINYMKYITLAKSEYRMLYQNQKWTVSKNDLSSGFYVGTPATINGITGGDGKCNDNDNDGSGKKMRRRRCNSSGRKACHNCRKLGHLEADCWSPGGVTHEGDRVDGGKDDEDIFPGVDPRALRRPPCDSDPISCTLLDGTTVRWFSLCGYREEYFRGEHT